MTGMFIILSIDAYRAVKDHVTASLSAAASITAIILYPQSMLLIALLALVCFLILRHLVQGRQGACENSTQESQYA